MELSTSEHYLGRLQCSGNMVLCNGKKSIELDSEHCAYETMKTSSTFSAIRIDDPSQANPTNYNFIQLYAVPTRLCEYVWSTLIKELVQE
jgi:hypothetical protein